MFHVNQASHTIQQPAQSPRVSFEEALSAFASAADMARKFGVSRASVAEWKENGQLPEGRVWQLIAMYPEQFGHLKAAA